MLSDYQLYVSNNCGGCKKVLNELKQENIIITTINIDVDPYNLSYPILIFPALVKNEKLIGYGANDIIKHLKAKF